MNRLDMSKHPLTKLMEEKGFETVAEFARACELSPQSIFVHIRGKYRPDMYRMFLYARVLSVPVEEIIKIFFPDDWKQNYS